MSRVLTVTANPLLNLAGPEPVTDGAVTRVPRLVAAAEGKGINVARQLVWHGHDVTALGFVGGDTGHWFTELVDGEGIPTAFTATAARLRTGFMVPSATASHPTTLLEDGFAVIEAEAALLVASLTERLAGCDLVIVSGSVPDPSLANLYTTILSACAAHGVTCWIDAYGPAMINALASDHPPALAKPNRQEVAQGGAWDRCPEVHCSDGGGALSVRAGATTYQVTPPAIGEVNPIGSGDCYLAGLAHARLVGMALTEQIAYACAAGAANAMRDDVAQIRPDDIAPLRDQVQIRSE